MMIGSETAAIDRWVEPAHEPGPYCHKCGHEVDYHDKYGCYAPAWQNFQLTGGEAFEVPCDCKEFSYDD